MAAPGAVPVPVRRGGLPDISVSITMHAEPVPDKITHLDAADVSGPAEGLPRRQGEGRHLGVPGRRRAGSPRAHALTVTDVLVDDLRSRRLIVTGKGGKVRTVVIGTETAMALRRYLRERARGPLRGVRGAVARQARPADHMRAGPAHPGHRAQGGAGHPPAPAAAHLGPPLPAQRRPDRQPGLPGRLGRARDGDPVRPVRRRPSAPRSRPAGCRSSTGCEVASRRGAPAGPSGRLGRRSGPSACRPGGSPR